MDLSTHTTRNVPLRLDSESDGPWRRGDATFSSSLATILPTLALRARDPRRRISGLYSNYLVMEPFEDLEDEELGDQQELARLRQKLEGLRAGNHDKWQHLLSMLHDDHAHSSMEESMTWENSMSHGALVSKFLSIECDLMEQSPYSPWRNRIQDQLAKLTSKSVDEETMLQYQKEIITNYQELLQVQEHMQEEIVRQEHGLQLLEHQLNALKELLHQLKRISLEALHDDESNQTVATKEMQSFAIDQEYERLSHELATIADCMDQHYFPATPVTPVSKNERYLRQLLDSPGQGPTLEMISFQELMQVLIHKLAAYENEQDQFLLVQSIDESRGDLTSSLQFHNARHIEFLLELAMLEAYQDNPKLVRLLPEYGMS